MGRAFNMADMYQTPVIVLGDQHLNDSYYTIDELDPDRVTIDRGKILSDEMISSPRDYKRYTWDESGISPRILPGLSDAVIYADSDEHTEEGHITEDARVRERMMKKRMKKLESMQKEMVGPLIYPSGKSSTALLGWGSTLGAMKEAVDCLNKEGLDVQMIHYTDIYPFPLNGISFEDYKDVKILAVENNYSAQFAKLFTQETGFSVSDKILKFDGRPISSIEIIRGVKEAVKGEKNGIS
jgi:2-oxoglutarate ferredoxin oxidoreductase subunit alpha